MGCAMALSGQAARRRQCLQHRSWLGREWRKTVWARKPQGCQHHPGHTLPFPSILPLTSSQNHCTRSPGGGKVRKGILTSHSVGGYCAVKFRAKISYGDYLGASIILALVYLSISSWLYCGELMGLAMILLWAGTRRPRETAPIFPSGCHPLPPPCPGLLTGGTPGATWSRGRIQLTRV